MNPTDCFVFDLRPDRRQTKPMASRAIEGRRPACNAIPIANSHHRIEHRHARQLSGGKRRCYDNPIQEQARQNFVTVPAGPSLDD
jgi:hypothetical protein